MVAMIPAWRARAREELAGYEPAALGGLEPTLVVTTIAALTSAR